MRRRIRPAVAPVFKPAKIRAPGPLSSTTHASVFRSRRSDDYGWMHLNRRSLIHIEQLQQQWKAPETPGNLPAVHPAIARPIHAMVLPLSGPSATRLGCSSRSLRSHASPIGPSPGNRADSRRTQPSAPPQPVLIERFESQGVKRVAPMNRITPERTRNTDGSHGALCGVQGRVPDRRRGVAAEGV